VAEPILIAGGRAIEDNTEVFVGTDVANWETRSPWQIAGSRDVRYLGEFDADDVTMRGVVKRLADKHGRVIFAMKPDQQVMASTDQFNRWAMNARWWHRRLFCGELATM
jgi:hypothetical protein